MNIKTLSNKTEKVSQNYIKKFNIERNDDWFLLKLQEELGELTQSYLKLKGKAKTEGKSEAELKDAFAKETADVFCQVLLLAKHNDIDLEKEIEQKWLIWNKNTD